MKKKIHKYHHLLWLNQGEEWDLGVGLVLVLVLVMVLERGMVLDRGMVLVRGMVQVQVQAQGLTFYQIYLKVQIKVQFQEVQLVMQLETTHVVIIQVLYVMVKI